MVTEPRARVDRVVTDACGAGRCGDCWVEETDVVDCDCPCHPWSVDRWIEEGNVDD